MMNGGRKFIKRPLLAGFTALEWLTFASIVAVISSMGIIAFNPSQHSSWAKNAKRWNDVNALSNGIYQYKVLHEGALPFALETKPKEICKQQVEKELCESLGLLYLSELVPDILAQIPHDPDEENGQGGGYVVSLAPDMRIIVSAPDAQIGDVIRVMR